MHTAGILLSSCLFLKLCLPAPPLFLYLLPEQEILFKYCVQSSCVFQPGQIGTDCASHKNILLEIHDKAVFCEQALQNHFETKRFLTEAYDFIRYLIYFVYIVLSQFCDILAASAWAGTKSLAFSVFTFSSVFR